MFLIFEDSGSETRVGHEKISLIDNFIKSNLSIRSLDTLFHLGITRILQGKQLVFSFINEEKEAQKGALSCFQFPGCLQVKL